MINLLFTFAKSAGGTETLPFLPVYVAAPSALSLLSTPHGWAQHPSVHPPSTEPLPTTHHPLSTNQQEER
jgi:hypothetical protein